MTANENCVILLISGKRFSGKDTVASILQTLLRAECPESTVETFAFASECKRLYCEANDGLKLELFENREFKEAHRDSLTKFFEHSDINFAQVVADRIKMRDVDVAIVADWRFETDFEAMKKHFSRCVRVRVDADDEQKRLRGWSFLDRKDTNATEVSLDDAAFDFRIANNTTISAIEQQLRTKIVPCVQTMMDCKNTQTGQTYDYCAKKYSHDVRRQMEVQKAILNFCLEDNTETVLDVGCGAGIIGHTVDAYFQTKENERTRTVTALDVSLEMCREANKAFNCVAECCDWLRYDCASRQFDLVVGQAYLHLYEPELEAVKHLAKMLNATKRRCYVSTTLEEHFSVQLESKSLGDAPYASSSAPNRLRVRHTAETWLKLMQKALHEHSGDRFQFVSWKMADTDGRMWINTLFYDRSASESPSLLLQNCYREQGFVVVRNFEPRTDRLEKICEKVKIEPHEGVLRYEVASGFDRAENMICFEETFGSLCKRMQNLCELVVARTNLVYLKDKLNYKHSGRGAFPAHQDARAGWNEYAEHHFTVAIALDRCDAQSGALEVVAGALDTQQLLDGPNPIDDRELHNVEWTLLDMQRGDVVVFNSLVIHRSGANESNGDRKLWLVTFVDSVTNSDAIQHFYDNKRARQPTMDDGVARDAARDAFGKLQTTFSTTQTK